MNTYDAFYESRKSVVEAESLYAAKLAAVAHFKPRKSREHMVSVVLTKLGDRAVALHDSNADLG